ncbi:hypothetical protein TEA_029185 [Camellia sinensis var. sinensis]|uniref:Toprim domain-containing protein n=1 Tax=Camellia sinensis var. sinensis TaxID=542762 RepID=A0A4S4D562_CAMSN|nr:hypothetical protein TEA_029185 [Camellia sinensis var. sinensis]
MIEAVTAASQVDTSPPPPIDNATLPVITEKPSSSGSHAELDVDWGLGFAKAGDGKVTLSSLAFAVSSRVQSGLDLHQLNIILKVDVQGTIEAVRQALQMLPQENVTLKFLLQVTGDISSSDVDLAFASKAIVLGFNVKAPGSVKSYADNKGVAIRLYRVIYDLIDDVRKAMEGLLEPVEEQVKIGAAEVRAIFSSGSGRVAGCMVSEGKVVKDCGIRVLRNGKTVYVGILNSLRRVKEMVKEAVLPLRGKILNIERKDEAAMYKNEEIQNLILGLGLGVKGEDFKKEALRYHKIIILTDADVDDAHIRTLLLTFFFRYQMGELVHKAKLYRTN